MSRAIRVRFGQERVEDEAPDYLKAADIEDAWLQTEEGQRWMAMDEAEEALFAQLGSVCAICGGTGTISFSHEPYSRGFGLITEAVRCPCRVTP